MIPSNLTTSVRNLWDEFGHTDNLLFGIGVSLLLAVPGIAVWWLYTGWIAWLGAIWALLNLLPIIQTVMQL